MSSKSQHTSLFCGPKYSTISTLDLAYFLNCGTISRQNLHILPKGSTISRIKLANSLPCGTISRQEPTLSKVISRLELAHFHDLWHKVQSPSQSQLTSSIVAQSFGKNLHTFQMKCNLQEELAYFLILWHKVQSPVRVSLLPQL